MRPHVRRDAIQDLCPLLVGRDRLQLAVGQLDGEVELAAVAEVDDAARGCAVGPAARLARADQEAGDRLDRPLRGREADALGPLLRQRLEALQREREVRPALVPRHRVDLVHDHGAHVAEALAAAPGRHQEIQGLGRRDQQMGRLAEHRGAGAGRRVARAGDHPQIRDDQPELARHLADLRERALEVLPDVGREGLEGRHVDDLGPELAARARRAAARKSRSMPTRKAASVLPEPVGAAISVSSPAAIEGQPRACGSVGPSGKRRSNHVRIAGWKSASPSIGIECTLWPAAVVSRVGPRRDGARAAGSGDHAARRLPQRAASGRRRPGAPLRRDGRAGAPDPGARVRLDLGRRAPRHARVPLLPPAPAPPAPRRRGRRALGGHEPDPAAAPQPGRGGGDRRLPGRDHRRAVPPRGRARLPGRGVRHLRGADGRAGQPARRGDRDHPATLDGGRGHPSRPPLAPRRRDDPTAPAPAAAAAHPRRARRCPPGSRARPASPTAGWWCRCRPFTSSRRRPPPSRAPGPRRACRRAGTSAA